MKKLIDEEKIKTSSNIDLIVLNDQTFISPFCGDDIIISEDVASYLNTSYKRTELKFDISIKIKSDSIEEKKKPIYEKAIRNYYKVINTQIVHDLIINKWISLSMFLMGLIVISIMILISLKTNNQIINTVLEIVGWVFIWESVDQFVFERRKMKLEYIRNVRLMNSKITFEPFLGERNA